MATLGRGTAATNRSSLLQYVKEQNLSTFCLVHSLQSTSCCTKEEEENGELNQSTSLFESPLPQSSTGTIIPPQTSLVGAVKTPSKVVTPLTLHVDHIERVWSPAMATPTSSRRSLGSNVELITSWDQSVSLEEEEEEREKRVVTGGGEKVKERLRIQQGGETIVRRLFHSQPKETTPTQPHPHNNSPGGSCDIQDTPPDSTHCNDSMEILQSPQSSLKTRKEESNEIINDLTFTPLCEKGSEKRLSQNLPKVPISTTPYSTPSLLPPSKSSSLCLDVLFMSNSQLDAMESNNNNNLSTCDINDHTPIFRNNNDDHNDYTCNKDDGHVLVPQEESNNNSNSVSLHMNNGTPNSVSLHMNNSTPNSVSLHMNNSTHIATSNKREKEHSIDCTDKVTVTMTTKEFIYPTNTQVDKSLTQQLPAKRPHPLGLLKTESSSKKLKESTQQLATPTLPLAMKSLQTPDVKMTCTNIATPLSRPKGSYKVPRSKDRVNEREEKTTIQRILNTFNPSLTSTPSLSSSRGQLNILHHQGVLSLYNTGSNKELNLPAMAPQSVQCLFKTGSGKELVLNKSSLEKVRELVEEIEVSDEKEEHLLIQKDECGLQHQQNESEGWSLPTDMDWDEFSHFTQLPTDSSSLINSNNDQQTTPPLQIPPTHGFMTASGRNVNISENSYKVARNLLHDIETTPTNHLITPTTTTTNTSNDHLLTTPTAQLSLGFSTGSGKSVHVSDNALIKACSILTTPSKEELSSSVQFTTASGKGVVISKESIEATKGIFDDIHQTPPTLNNAPPTLGFTTASGKGVAISIEALKAVRNIFDDNNETRPTLATPITETPPTHQLGFTTASGKGVAISKEALASVKNIFTDDIINDAMPSFETPPTHQLGFTTASGKGVAISEKSLKAVKGLFNDTNTTETVAMDTSVTMEKPVAMVTTPVGFSTAGGRDVSISKEALDSVRSLLVTPPKEKENKSLETTPLAPPTGFRKPDCNNSLLRKRSGNRRGRVSKPDRILYDRSEQLKSKISKDSLNEATPLTTPSHLKFKQGGVAPPITPANCPVWKGDLTTISTSQQTTPPSSPLNLTFSQLTSLTNTSPLSPTTLNSSRLNIVEDSSFILNKAPPSIVNSPNREIHRQEGTILRARVGPGCQRIPLVAMAIEGKRVGGYSRDELLIKGVSPKVLSVTAATADEFIFEGHDFFSPASLRRGWVCVGDGVMLKLNQGRVGVNELWNSFSVSPGIDSSLISKEWFINHYKWIIWKLASLEVCFPDQWAGRCLTVDWCLMQCKYRYDLEIDAAKRSIIHKICEGDDTPTRLMILCVSHVASTDTSEDYSIELTDGWYFISAKLDTPLSLFVGRGLIKVGSKLLICGAELLGDPTHGHPLEVSKGKSLSLCANSVRRAHWSARLGVLPRPFPPSFSLSSIIPQGGVVPSIKVIVARQYPVLYVEKTSEGGRVFRRQKEEEKLAKEWEELRQKKMELIYSQVEKKFQQEIDNNEGSNNKSRRRSGRLTSRSVKHLQDGHEIYTQLQLVTDPDTFMELLTPTQLTLLESYKVAMATKRQEKFQATLKKAVEESNELPVQRNISTLQRLLLVQYGPHPSSTVGMLSGWNISNEMREQLKEGTPLRITGVMANSSYHEGKLQLSSIKSTHYKPLPKLLPLMINHQPRKYTSLCDLSSSSFSSCLYNEIDTVGLIVTCLSQQGEKKIDVLYITDDNGCILIIKVWEGLKVSGIESLVNPGCLVAISNLRYLGKRVGSTLPTCHVTDRTVFAYRPQEEHLLKAISLLENNLPTDRSQLIESLQETITQVIT